MKTFVIGLSKTGTTTLEEALRLLGLQVAVFPRSLKEIRAADAASDLTVALNFKRLDEVFPGSRFLYTTRALEPWLRSCRAMWQRQQQHFDADPFIVSLHEAAYGGRDFNAARFAAHYRRHDAAVRDHFATRPHDLLILGLAQTAAWQPLCGFLGMEEPALAFPHANQTHDIDRFIAHVRAAVGDSTRTADLLGLPPAEIARPAETGTAKPFLVPHRNWELDRMLWRLHQAYGSIETAAEALGLDPRLAADWRKQSLTQSPVRRIKQRLARLTAKTAQSSPWF